MATGVASWSKTASVNAAADQNVNMAEGMAPAQVNDGCRAMMASTAMWRDDLAGITTAGTSTAYTVTTNQGFATALALDGRLLTVVMHTSSGTAPTLSVDGLAAQPMRLQTGVAPSAGVFVQGSAYTFRFSYPNLEFVAINQAAGIPPGAIMAWPAGAAPNGWLLCQGQQVSTTAFAALYSLIGTTFGSGAGTFALPDLRGCVIAGLDAGRGILTFASSLGAFAGVQNFTLALAQLPNYAPPFTGNALPAHNHNAYQVCESNSPCGNFVHSSSSDGHGQVAIDVNGGTSAGTPSGTVGSINGSQAQILTSSLQPTLALNWIIKY